VFAGTPEFARVALQALHEAGHEVVLVLTQPDRPAGRGMALLSSPVKTYALSHGLALAQPWNFKDPVLREPLLMQMRDLGARVMVVAAYGLILPQIVLDAFEFGCVNIHASELPRWRGAAPIQRAIQAADMRTGVTIMQMEAGLDTGPMLSVDTIAISPTDTAASLHDKLAAMGAELIVKSLQDLPNQLANARTQPELGVTYASKISKDEASLDWGLSAQTLERTIRAWVPFPIANTHLHQTTIKIHQAEVVDVEALGLAEPGTVIALDLRGVTVACGEGALRLTVLQRPGGKKQPASQFLQGFALQLGDQFDRTTRKPE
jgi:methionyl-tRNA formyltransferase